MALKPCASFSNARARSRAPSSVICRRPLASSPRRRRFSRTQVRAATASSSVRLRSSRATFAITMSTASLAALRRPERTMPVPSRANVAVRSSRSSPSVSLTLEKICSRNAAPAVGASFRERRPGKFSKTLFNRVGLSRTTSVSVAMLPAFSDETRSMASNRTPLLSFFNAPSIASAQPGKYFGRGRRASSSSSRGTTLVGFPRRNSQSPPAVA